MRLKKLAESLVKSQSYSKNRLGWEQNLTGKHKVRLESDLVKKHVLGHSRAAYIQMKLTSMTTTSHGAFQCHYLRIRAIDVTTIPATKRPHSPLLLHLWKESGYSGLESIIFKTWLFSNPRLANMSLWRRQNLCLCLVFIKVLCAFSLTVLKRKHDTSHATVIDPV